MYDVSILRVQVVQRADFSRLGWRRRKAMLEVAKAVVLGVTAAESRRLRVADDISPQRLAFLATTLTAPVAAGDPDALLEVVVVVSVTQ